MIRDDSAMRLLQVIVQRGFAESHVKVFAGGRHLPRQLLVRVDKSEYDKLKASQNGDPLAHLPGFLRLEGPVRLETQVGFVFQLAVDHRPVIGPTWY